MQVLGALEETEEEESGRNAGIQDAEEDESRDHEGEGHLLVDFLEGPEGGSSHVLVSDEGIDNSSDNAEDDDLANGDSPEGLGEVPRPFSAYTFKTVWW